MEAKTEEFALNLQNGAVAAKLMAHPARMAILDFLGSQDTCMTGDISSHLPLSRGTVNQHLKALKEAGWVKGTIQGSKICYCIDQDKFNKDTEELLAFIKSCGASCGGDC